MPGGVDSLEPTRGSLGAAAAVELLPSFNGASDELPVHLSVARNLHHAST